MNYFVAIFFIFSLKLFSEPVFTILRQYGVQSDDADADRTMICNFGKSWDDEKIQLE